MTTLPPEDEAQQPSTPGLEEQAGTSVPGGQPQYLPPVYQASAPQQQAFPQPGYQQPAYLNQPQGQMSKPPTNVFAILGIIGVFFLGLAGIIFGHIALSQIKRSGESGRGLALAATIIGYVRVAFTIIGTILAVVFFGFLGTVAASTSSGSSGSYDPEGSSLGYQEPWIGTEDEAFCTALNNYDLLADDPKSYYTELKAANTDAAFGELIDQQIAAADADYSASTSEDADRMQAELDAFYEAYDEKSNACWAM